MEDPGAVQASTPTPSAPIRSTCSSCGGATATEGPNQGYVTLVGQVSMLFTSRAVEKEFAQLLGNKEFTGFTERKTLHGVLSKKENTYLARKMCSTLAVYGTGFTPGFVLIPEVPNDLDLIVDTLRRPAGSAEVDVVKGRIVGMAPSNYCLHLELPVVSFCQLYSFSIDSFVKGIPRSEKIPAKDFEAVANETFHRLMRIAAKGFGADRCLTYSALSYAGLYQLVFEKNAENYSLSEISVNQSKSSPDNREIRLKFRRRDTSFTEMYRFIVNCAEAFEFLVEPLQPTYEAS